MAKILFATTAEGVKFYPVTITDAVVHIKGNTQKKLSEIIDEIDYTGKADKVASATNGNFAGLDSNGNLTDSGYKAADFQAAGSYKTTQTAVSDPTASGNAVAFIDSISQDANGEITVTKKNVQSASDSQAGLMSAADFTKLGGIEAGAQVNVIESISINGSAVTPSNKGIDLGSNYVQDANYVHTDNNLTDALKAQYDAAQANVIEAVKVNGSALTPDANKAVDVLIAEGTTNGAISVNGAAVAVHGLGSAALADSSAFDASGAAATAKSEVIGASTDAKTADTINGAKAYADDAVATALQGLAGALIYKGEVNGTTKTLPSTGMAAGDVYVVAAAGTYDGAAMEVGDYLIYNGTGWDKINGENQVSNAGASLTIGSAVTIATVDGTNIQVTQVEDMTKIEAVAVGDTTEYADVTALFSAA